MKITVFGASGGVGKKFVELALSQGHAVRAVYRTDPGLKSLHHFAVIVKDKLMDPEFIAEATLGSDAIVSCLGLRRANPANPWSKIIPPSDFTSRFSHLLIQNLRLTQYRGKVIAVSAGGIGESWKNVALPLRLLFKYSKIGIAYQDLNRVEEFFKHSDLDWVCVRPTTLTNKPLSKKIKIVEKYGFMSQISRADVAWFMCELLKQSSLKNRTPMIQN